MSNLFLCPANIKVIGANNTLPFGTSRATPRVDQTPRKGRGIEKKKEIVLEEKEKHTTQYNKPKVMAAQRELGS